MMVSPHTEEIFAAMQPTGREPLSDVDSFNNAMALPIQAVVSELCDYLGATTVAVIGGVKETRAVAQWAAGERAPQGPQRLRFALQLARMVASASDRDTARAWFHGSNPALDDRVPMLMLREEPLENIQPVLIGAARRFAERPTLS